MKEHLSTIQWLSRAFILVILNIAGLTISKIASSNADNKVYKIAQQLYNIEVSVDKTKDFMDQNSSKAISIVEDKVPLTMDLFLRHKFLNNKLVEYDGNDSSFPLSKRDERPKYYITYPNKVLTYKHISVNQWIDFYINEYNTNASVDYPDFDFFLKGLEREFTEHTRKGYYYKIVVTDQKGRSILQELETRMDTVQFVSVVCNISAYRDYFASVLDKTPISNHRTIIKVPYKHHPIPGTSLNEYCVFLEKTGVQIPYDYNTMKSEIEKNKKEIDQFSGERTSFMLLSTSPKENDYESISLGSVSIKTSIIFYTLPPLILVIIAAIFISTNSLFKNKTPEAIAPKNPLNSYYYPIPLPRGITQKTKNLIFFYLLFQVICFGLMLYAFNKSVSAGMYLFYALTFAINVFLIGRIITLLKSNAQEV